MVGRPTRVERPGPGGLDGEEVAGDDAARLRPQELGPAGTAASRGWTDASRRRWRPDAPTYLMLAGQLVSRSSGAGRQGPQSGKSGCSRLPLVVGEETVERQEVDRCGDVDRVQRTERRLRECSSRQQQGTVEL